MALRKAVLTAWLGCLVAACSGAQSTARLPSNRSIHEGLQRGMTERQVDDLAQHRIPDRVLQATCGTQTPAPFACKVYVFEGAGVAVLQDPKLSIIFSNPHGRWIVDQWR